MLNFNKKKYVSFDNLKSFNGLLQSSLKEKLDGYKSEVDTKVQKKFNELSGKVQTDSEVIDARKGEASLRAKIDVIDENLKNVDSQLAQNMNKINEQFNTKVSKDKETIYLNEYATKQGVTINKTTDISSLLQYCVNNYKNIIMPTGYDYRISNTIIITKNCNITCEGVLYVDDNVTAFIIGNQLNKVERNIFKINKVYGNGKNFGAILFSLQHAIYNQFIVNYAENIGKVIELKPISKNCSLGENQFKPHLWYGCDIAFHIMGADTWENRTWAEGSQILNGFISGCNYGVKIEKNVLYSGMLITCGIDNMEIPNSWDYYNGGNESPDYQIANLLLFRFIRFNRCQFKNIDSFWDANLKFKITGEVHCDGALRQEGTEGHFRINNAQAEIFNPNIVFFDFKNTLSNDYDIRMGLENGELEFTSKTASAFKVTKEGFKISRSGMNIAVGEGSTSATINHTYGITSDNYTVVCVPNWQTSYHLEVKNTVGFKVVFTNQAPPNAKFDYFIILG